MTAVNNGRHCRPSIFCRPILTAVAVGDHFLETVTSADRTEPTADSEDYSQGSKAPKGPYFLMDLTPPPIICRPQFSARAIPPLHKLEACSAVGIAKPDFLDEVSMSYAKY